MFEIKENKKKQITIRITEGEKKALQEKAKEQNLNISNFIRCLIKDYLKA